jgi:hypothetical protein
MAEPTETPYAWRGRQVHLEYQTGEGKDIDNGTLEEVNDRGVRVSEGDRNYFYPWTNVVRIGLGHKQRPGSRTTRVH